MLLLADDENASCLQTEDELSPRVACAVAHTFSSKTTRYLLANAPCLQAGDSTAGLFYKEALKPNSFTYSFFLFLNCLSKNST